MNLAKLGYDSWRSGGLPWLNVAKVEIVEGLLGPGLRGVVLVQGCLRRCPGCVAPEWQTRKSAQFIQPEALADHLLSVHGMSGLTFSGGEPMLQAAGLADLVRRVQSQREITVICFTGYWLESLRRRPPAPGVADLLAVTDVLIDGPYEEALNDDKGLRGSSNQRIHFLTPTLQSWAADFADRPRRAAVYVEDESIHLIGVPPLQMVEAVEQVLYQMRKEPRS